MSKLLVSVVVVFSVPLPGWAPRSAWEALRELNTALELAAPDAATIPNFAAEIEWTRTHWLQTRDCPPLSECARLPSHKACEQQWYRATRVVRWLESAQQERLHWDLTDILPEARRCEQWWQLAQQATDPHVWWYQRRLALKEILR
jgi:hypothetical protein